MLSRKKKILFNSIILFVIILFFVLLETGARLLTPSLDNPLVTEVRYDGKDWYKLNRGYLKKYFPAGSISVPEFKEVLFRKEKPATLFRVVALGGSSMFGTPYQMTANIPGILRKQLRHLYPQTEFEVINLAASAINSQVIRDLAPQILRFDPDLVVIYMGHNEFYGPDGVGASALEKKMPFITRLKYRLRDLRLFRLFRQLLAEKPDLKNGAEHNLMKQVSRESQVPLHSPDADRIFNQFRTNLKDIVSVYRQRNIPVVVSDVTSNLSFTPFAWETEADGQNVEDLLMEVKTEFLAGKYDAALRRLQQVNRADSANALIRFWLGTIYRKTGDYEQARRHLMVARDLDLLKFRAPSEINAIISDVCKTTDTPLVSAVERFAALSPHAVTDTSLFWEHLHPKSRGYYELADLFVDKIVEQGYVPDSGRLDPLFARKLPFDDDSLSICWLDLAYADLAIKNLTGKWPFRNYHTEAVVFPESDESLQRLAMTVFHRRSSWDEGCYKSAAYFMRTGNYRAARTTYEAMIEEYPYNFYTHYLLATLFKNRGELSGALRHYQISIASKPDYVYSRLDAGMVEINLGYFDRAIEDLTRALNLVNGSSKKDIAMKANIYYGLAAAHANRREMETALQYSEKALKLVPSYQAAAELRQRLLHFVP